MINFIISQIEEIMRTASDTYGVNPIIFLVIYLICVPIFYYSIVRTLRAFARKLTTEAMIWSAVFLLATVAPFIYVILFGRNIPWWVYVIIAILIGQGIISLIIRLRRNVLPKSN